MPNLRQKILRPIYHQWLNHQWGLGLMMLSLHSIILLGFSSVGEKVLCMMHYGFFLLWQPLWRVQKQVSAKAIALFLLFGSLFIYLINWWMLAFWICLLFAFLGGRVFSTQAKSTRIGYLISTTYLLLILLFLVIPKLLVPPVIFDTNEVMTYVMPFLLAGILWTKIDTSEKLTPPVLDFFYTVLLFLSACLLILGCFAIESSGVDYATLLLTSLFCGAFLLIVASWFWQPHAGSSGISQLFSRYLLSIGLPFENWVKNIADLAKTKPHPKGFINAAMQEVMTLDWIYGVSWSAAGSVGELGKQTKHHEKLKFNQLELRIDTRWALTPAMMMHVKLLTQIVGEFYEAKRREEENSQNAYMQAFYETGSRLTHDMKNLIQSVSGLCTVAEQSAADDSERLAELMRRQLPLLNQRMERTLEKLTAPNAEHQTNNIVKLEKLSDWWEALKIQYEGSNIDFRIDRGIKQLINKMKVNSEFMDSIADNLIQNAVRKRNENKQLKITVHLSNENDFALEVVDNGKAMPAEKAEQLFKQQVESDEGWGIGLYQASRQAEQMGYRLLLVNNEDGKVRFRLSREAH